MKAPQICGLYPEVNLAAHHTLELPHRLLRADPLQAGEKPEGGGGEGVQYGEVAAETVLDLRVQHLYGHVLQAIGSPSRYGGAVHLRAAPGPDGGPVEADEPPREVLPQEGDECPLSVAPGVRSSPPLEPGQPLAHEGGKEVPSGAGPLAYLGADGAAPLQGPYQQVAPCRLKM